MPAFFTTVRRKYWINTVSMEIYLVVYNDNDTLQTRRRFTVDVDLTQQAYRGGLKDYTFNNEEQMVESNTVLHLEKNVSIAVQSGEILVIHLPPYDAVARRENMIPLINRVPEISGAQVIPASVPYIHFEIVADTDPPTSNNTTLQASPAMSSDTSTLPVAIAFIILFVVALLVILVIIFTLCILLMKRRLIFEPKKSSIQYETATGYHATTETG